MVQEHTPTKVNQGLNIIEKEDGCFNKMMTLNRQLETVKTSSRLASKEGEVLHVPDLKLTVNIWGFWNWQADAILLKGMD